MPPAAGIDPGSVIPFRGAPHRVESHPERPRRVQREGGRLLIGGPEENIEGRLLRWFKAQALELLTVETAEFAAKAGVDAARVGVGDPVSRWGSCSSSGTVRYSWRLILAPDFVRRATVAHEVAHLVHLDHSPRFHALVKELLGEDPRPARLWLRREGAALHQVGRRS
jgi:predicted metal-dependent hydrolase